MTGCSKGYAFIEFYSESDAFRAYHRGHRTSMANGSRDIVVDIVRAGKEPGFVPRRLGGGHGGKIKSSQVRFGGRDKPFY